MSYIEVKADTVAAWCEDTIKVLDAAKEKSIKSRVDELAKPTKLFGLTIAKGLDRDVAEQEVLTGRDIHNIMARDPYPMQRARVENLLKLARVAVKANGLASMMHVSTKDISNLVIRRSR